MSACLSYTVLGADHSDAGTVVLSAGLGGTAAFWKPQIEALAGRLRVIVYDHAGTGSNARPLAAGYRIGDMADDVLAILDDAGIERAAVLGHALGGLVGLDLALKAPGRVSGLVLVNAWAKADAHTGRCFAARRELLLKSGIEAYVAAQPIFLYPSWWLSRNAARVAEEEAHGIAHFQGTDTILKRIDALMSFDVSDRLGEIETPCLVMAARDDVLVPWLCSEQLAAGLPNARLEVVAEGGHGFSVVEPAPFNEAVLDFLMSERVANRLSASDKSM